MNIKQKIPMVLIALLPSLFLTSSVIAQVDSAIVEELRAQIEALSSRLEQLERGSELISQTVEQNQSYARASSWIERMRISGDLRPRFENIDDALVSSDRNRNRIRARVAVEAELNDNWSAGVGLASGGTDPISANQSFGGGGFTKDLGLDLAYVTYQGFTNTALTAGKYRNVFFTAGGNGMVFDSDYRPEGVAVEFKRDKLFFNAGTMILESDDNFDSQDKETLWGMQLGYEFSLDSGSLTVGTSYYDASVAGSMPFYLGDPYSNSVDAAGALVNDYHEWELFAEASFTVAGKPLRLYSDYITNLDADEFDTGWALGVTYGSARGLGNWEVGYGYQDLEADAILGSLTDSDFAGGGTDNEGHILEFAYGLGDSTRIGFTYTITEYGEARLGKKEDYNRLQLDLQLGF
ncbi:MAG: putative porin [Proteobacteria bacterium]|nr:putative porin [Pseudomonadota bacterium]